MTRATLTCLALLVVGASALADQPPQTQPANIRQTMRGIWRDDIEAPKDAPTEDLSRAVRQLQAMVLTKSRTPATTGQSPAPSAGGVDVSIPVETPAESPATTQLATTQPATKPASKTGVSPAELTLLKLMAVEKLTNALGVADELYRAGQYEAALAVYMRLQEHPPKNMSGDWLLFQLANCQSRRGNYVQAGVLYQKMIAKFPASPWLAVAKVQGQLAAWRQEAKPAELLKPPATDG